MAVSRGAMAPRTLSLALYVLTAAVVVAGAALVGPALASRPAGAAVPASVDMTQVAQQAPAAGESSAAAYLAMADASVFGAPPQQPAAAPEAPDLPVSATIVGTIVRGDLSRAIVETAAGTQKLLRVGDPLEGGRIAQITLTGVVLERGGRKIELPVRASGRPHATPNAAPAPPPRAIGLRPTEPAGQGYSEEDIESGDIDLRDFGAFYGDLKDAFLAAQAKTAHDVAGKPVGLVFDGVAEGGLLWRMGLRPADIVTEVNAIPVANMNDLLNAFDKVAAQIRSEDETFIVIDLVRDQRPDALILTIW